MTVAAALAVTMAVQLALVELAERKRKTMQESRKERSARFQALAAAALQKAQAAR